MPDDERIEQLELENKVLQANNKGLKAKIDELWNKLDEKNAELEKEKEKNKELEDTLKQTQESWYEDTQTIEELRNQNAELRDELEVKNAELNKEKEKNKVYIQLLKQNENREKIKTCMTYNMPNNAEIICMIREDFERNFGNDYISKDKIKAKIEEVDKYGDCEIGSPPLYKTKKGIEIMKEDAELILQELLVEEE